MAKRRSINSDIFDDPWFGELPDRAQVLWVGLFCNLADDQGRLMENPTLIRSRIFPYKDVPLDEITTCIIQFSGHVIRYQVDSKDYIQIVKWWENQPMQYAVPSCYPAPPGWKDRYRTNYKGAKIVFNWEGQPDTPEGVSLYAKLGSLGRVSRWADYVGILNSNPNTYPNSIKKEEKKEPTTTAPAQIPGSTESPPEVQPWKYEPELELFKKITDFIPPFTDHEKVIENIQAGRKRLGAPPVAVVEEHMRKFYAAYCQTKNKAGALYNPRGVGWTEWFASGWMPPNAGTSEPEPIEENEDEPEPTPPAPKQTASPEDMRIWDAVAQQLALEMKQADYRTWVTPMKPLGWQGDTFRVACTNSMGAEWANSRIGKITTNLLTGITNKTAARVQFVMEAL